MENNFTSLDYSEYPDHHDPHRCGSAPFVPNVDGPRQHSCGSYADHFDENGCNRYMPNYPDDLYLEEHGCEGLADCKDGIPPEGDIGKEGTRFGDYEGRTQTRWPATGYEPPSAVGPACKEGFIGGFSLSNRNLMIVALVILVAWVYRKKLMAMI